MLNEEDRKKIITLAIVLLIVVIFVFYILPLFFKKEKLESIYPSQIILNEEELNLKTGESYKFLPDLYPSDSNKNKIKWTTSDENIAIVLEDGMVEAIRPGTAIITAETENNLTDFVIINVTVGNKEISSLELNMEDISLKVGTKKTFKVNLNPSTTQYEEVIWETNNNKVLTIDKNGEVYGLAVGKAIITAKVTINDSTTLSISSNVNVVKETTLSASSSSLKQLYPYKEQEVKVHISDRNIQIKDIEYYIDNSDVAVISQGAQVENNEYIVLKAQGVSPGSTNLSVKLNTQDGENLNITIPVIVKEFSGVSLDKTTITLEEGESTIVNAKLSPSIGANFQSTCSTNDSSVAQAYSAYANKDSYNGGCLIRGIKNGKATVVVNLQGKTKTITVNVTSREIIPTSITLNRNEAIVPVGQTFTLNGTIAPSDATKKTILWTSSDTSVATVSNGIVTAKKAGTAIITAKTSNNLIATAKITVTNTTAVIPDTFVETDRISIEPSTATLESGKILTLRATFHPSNATDQQITWTSSNSNIATVNDGVVTAKSISSEEETVTITATSGNGLIAVSTIKIVNKIKTQTINISLNKTSAVVEEGKTITLTATVYPENATNKTVIWTSSDTQIATVSNGVVSTHKKGSVTITAQASGGQSATSEIDVIAKSYSGGSSGGGGSSSGGSSVGSSSGSTSSSKPKITITKVTGTAGNDGWYKSDVSLKVSVEAEAGIESIKYCISENGSTCTPTLSVSNNGFKTFTTQGKTLQLIVAAKDKAGNTVTQKSSKYKIDKTRPTCTIINSPTSSGGSTLTVSASDTYSGLQEIKDWTGKTTNSRAVSGAGTYKFTIKDKAGNTNSCSIQLYKCGRARSCKVCKNNDCTTGCTTWNSWSNWQPWNNKMYSVQTQTAFSQIESRLFSNSNCTN